MLDIFIRFFKQCVSLTLERGHEDKPMSLATSPQVNFPAIQASEGQGQ